LGSAIALEEELAAGRVVRGGVEVRGRHVSGRVVQIFLFAAQQIVLRMPALVIVRNQLLGWGPTLKVHGDLVLAEVVHTDAGTHKGRHQVTRKRESGVKGASVGGAERRAVGGHDAGRRGRRHELQGEKVSVRKGTGGGRTS